ncbi:hypothetical protein FAZ69_08390 [Trinickia terrae]|uniref:Uncharacterized protein n=1 Tax=Trinickia terrae TaxID=2571161 RepID=A0A4U1I9Q7_9BURK|nr:hypothetical protein [Trinickia terrae]TKC90157.1 hypothetical protein FAZ69_08390 [Trinickia terrae]
MTTIMSIAGAYPAISQFITSLFALIGVLMMVSAIRGLYYIQAHGTYAQGGYQHRTNGGLVWRLLIGSILTMGAWGVGIVGNTVFGSQVATGAMGYQAAGLSATQQAAVQAVFACFSLVGYISFGHGWMLLDAHTSGRSQGGWKPPIVFIVSGVILVYMQQFLNIEADITGVNVVDMLVF